MDARIEMSRRVVLAVGAATLVGGCAVTTAQAVPLEPSPAGSPSGSPGTSPSPDAPSPSPSPTASTSASVPAHAPRIAADRPARGVQQMVAADGHRVALTIDDGPHPVWTPQVLGLLRRLDVRATFFMIGSNAQAHPDLVAAVAADGHVIANHTWGHPLDLSRRSRGQVDGQVHRTSDLLERLTGTAPTLFRAPGGAWSSTILASCADAGLQPVDWSVDPRDWSRPGVGRIVDVLVGEARPGAILLDHDGGGDRSQTVAALRIALPRLLDQGYRFVTP